MGIFELAQSGSDLRRQTVTVASVPAGSVQSASVAFGTSYILLNATVEGPCRIRLYSDSASVGLDADRPTSSFDVSASVGLTLEAVFTGSTTQITFDPPIIGTTFSDSETWYNISSSATQDVTFTVFPIEFSEYATRTQLVFMGAGILTASTGVPGNIVSPNGFLLLSGSADTASRLRLYSRPVESVPVGEQIRPFGTSPSTGSNLIADLMFDSGGFAYKIAPVLEGFNLEDYTQGNNQVGYILQNESATPSAAITASLYIYPIEN